MVLLVVVSVPGPGPCLLVMVVPGLYRRCLLLPASQLASLASDPGSLQQASLASQWQPSSGWILAR